MKNKIEIKNRFDDSVLFSSECEDNTLLKCVQEANLQYADLQYANLQGADLQEANLQYANLQDANLQGADLQDANLQYADLKDANLRGADLQDANLQGDNLQYANLQGADLQDANLQYADLQYANLQGADLKDANLRGALIGDIKIKKAIVFTGIYNYIAIPIIAEDDKQYVKLGCHLRSVEEWEKDFWNNNNEFPNDNSVKSQLRVLAYDTCKRWIEINK
jgi:hypothetical protein